LNISAFDIRSFGRFDQYDAISRSIRRVEVTHSLSSRTLVLDRAPLAAIRYTY